MKLGMLQGTPERGKLLLSIVTLSTVVGLVGGAGAALVFDRVIGGVGHIITGPSRGGDAGSGDSVRTIALAAAPSVVRIQTQPISVTNPSTASRGVVNGFIASKDGLIVTSAHAMNGATLLRVALSDGTVFDAVVVAHDAVHGIVVLRAAGAHDLTPLSFAHADAQDGDAVITVGIPMAGAHNIHVGNVSVTGSSVTDRPGAQPLAGAIVVDDVVDNTLDGAPMIDANGSVVAVATALTDSSSGPAGLVGLSGAAASRLVAAVGSGASGSVSEFGATSVVLGRSSAALFGVAAGAYVQAVDDASPAAAAGIVPGDVVTSVNGVNIDQDHPFEPSAFGITRGQQARITVVHSHASVAVSVTVTLPL